MALRAHLLHGASYRRLALVDPVAIAPWGTSFFRLVGENTEVFTQLHAALVRDYVKSASHGGLSDPIVDRLTAPWLGEQGQQAFYRQIAQADQRYTDDIQDRYHEVELPLLLCWGEEDTWLPLSQGHALTDRFGLPTMRVIAQAGHLVQEDAPAELASTLFAFLAGLR